MGSDSAPIYELEVTSIGPLVHEFTSHGVWVLFHEQAPAEVAEFALLHRAPTPQAPLEAGQILEIGEERYVIRAVGPIANTNLVQLGHLVIKANGMTEPELPGDVCIDSRPLPEPSIGLKIRVWLAEEMQ